MNCKTRKGRLRRHIGAAGLLTALAFSAACLASPASVDGPARGESDDCFGGALSSDPIHCEVLEWAHNGEVIDVDAVYSAGRALYIYLTRTSSLDDAARQKMLSKSREVARRTGEYECVLKPRLCGSGVLSGPDGGYILPRSSVYQTLEVFPGGAGARRSSPGWQVFEQLWPEVTGVVGGASGGDDDFDISGVDRTNLPNLRGNCGSSPVVDDAGLNDVCWMWERHPGLGIANFYDDTWNDKVYVYVKARAGEEAAKIAAAKTTLMNWQPEDFTNDRLVVVAVPHDLEELWRWSLVLERFANSSGNTLGITDARLYFNELGGLGKDRRYLCSPLRTPLT